MLKAGDKVRCVRDSPDVGLLLGSIYTVARHDGSDVPITLREIPDRYFYEDRFELVTKPETVEGSKSDEPAHDAVAHPKHYTSHPSGIECIQITEHMGFNLGNAVKYIWRCDLKQDAIEDLKKAKWYIDREIAKREKVNGQKIS